MHDCGAKRSNEFAGRCRALIAAIICAAIVGCATNPYTQRAQFVVVPDSFMNEIGAQQYEQILSDPNITISHDPREVEPVKRVAARIIEAAKQSKYAETAREFDWEVTVIKDDKTKNAWVLPGGKIAVYTGIFPIAKNEAGLAVVLGHEVVHALAKHGAERMSQALVAQFGLAAASIALSAQGLSPELHRLAMQAIGLGAQVGVLLPFSRRHESEADYVGLLLAAQAGYDPREAVRLWERMAQAARGRQPPEYLSTHPSHETRIANLQRWMPEALAIYRRVPKAPVSDLPPISSDDPPEAPPSSGVPQSTTGRSFGAYDRVESS